MGLVGMVHSKLNSTDSPSPSPGISNSPDPLSIMVNPISIESMYNLTILPNVTLPKEARVTELKNIFDLTSIQNATEFESIFNISSLPDIQTLEKLTGISNVTLLAEMFNITGIINNSTNTTIPIDQIPPPSYYPTDSPSPSPSPTNSAQHKTITIGIIMTIMTIASVIV
jgi:hypothetical protein